ncbi:hypothetical protein IWW36_001351 [Coemansia brasiliensis]|uniref:LIM zinc-binding domain-containing protein n=1 Tax=Coemansia brasiliensis TaxID=2650707 RepID=A0A9W8IBN9_9FUNG|nr:hypothetical protein IWW36_001351 [Coemansia brasiliensis]
MADRGRQVITDSPQQKQQRNSAPFKYDIRVTGDLYANQTDDRAATKVSVKILGNEDGDVVVEQDDARSLASPTPSNDGDTRAPQVSHKRLTDGGLELRIHALPVRAKKAAKAELLTGGGHGSADEDSSGSQLRTASSFAGTPLSRPVTRVSEYMRSRPLSSHQSFMEIRPAFDDGTVSDSECSHLTGAQTPQSMERSASPVLVGGGASNSNETHPPPPPLESRHRSASMTQVEDKCTMTTLRGFPDGLRACTPEKYAGSDIESEKNSRTSSPALSVLRGGGCCTTQTAGNADVFSAFNGPPVAPPDSRIGGTDMHQQLRPRRLSKDKVNYRERVESLLTQYFAPEILDKYLDELRHRYRFIGSGGMTSSEISKLLDESSADGNVKEQLRASLEALGASPERETSISDTEQSPSRRHYLSIRETELRNVLDRTSVSPAPKAPRFPPATSSNLVGGGVSMEDMGPGPHSEHHSTMRSDHMSVAASVNPSLSTRNGSVVSSRDSSRLKHRTKSMPIPEQAPVSDSEDAVVPEHALSQPTSKAASPELEPQRVSPEPETKSQRLSPEPQSEHQSREPSCPSPRSQPSTPRPERESTPRPPNSDGPRREKPHMPNSDYWEDDEKYKMRPPDMSQAFKVLKSKPIFIRELSSAEINFRSPFSRAHPAPDTHASSSSRQAAGSTASRGSKFSERHPTESKVAKAVSELEEVLRRTEAETLASIESDFDASSSPRDASRSTAGSRRPPSHAESVVSRDSLVGGGASSRSTSAATRISALGAKYGSRPGSASKMSASQSTIRTDVLLKEGIEYGDADRIDEEDEAAVPVDQSENNQSSVTLPMPLDEMPPELAAVLRRTGASDNARLSRTTTPQSAASSVASRHSAVSRPGQQPSRAATAASRASKVESLKGSAPSRSSGTDHSSVRSSASRATAAGAASGNRSLTELDIVMGRTGGAISRSAAVSSRASSASAKTEDLRGGSGSPVANDSENELASVLRRTSGYAPSVTDSSSASLPLEDRPISAASELKSVYPVDTQRPSSGIGSQRSNRSYAPGLREQDTASQRSQPLRSAAQSPARSSVRSSAVPGSGASGYTPSPLRKPAYQPSERHTPSPAVSRSRQQFVSPPPQSSRPNAEDEQEDEERSQAPPSPMPYRLPTPLFGRFPSPPPHIKNRGRANNEEPPQEPASVSRSRPHSQSVSQDAPPSPSGRQYPEEDPVVDRLDLETGSLASRRSRPRNGSEFGSASTLMSGQNRDSYNLPKVVEEDVDSLASYPSSVRPRSPNLVGGGRSQIDHESQAPSTLRGGGRIHPAFASKDDTSAKAKCDAGCCGVCGEGISKSDVVVRPQVMHASCLRCEACDCLLTTSTFRAIDGHVYCEKDYQRFFSGKDAHSPKVVSVHAGISDEKFQAMNRAIMESFTSVDDFLQHMRQLRERNGQAGDGKMMAPYSGDPTQVKRAGDIDLDRQTHYERDYVTSPSGTPWITERVVDKKVKTKVLEKRYPADGSTPSSVKSKVSEPAKPAASTLMGGGASSRPPSKAARMEALRSNNHSSASRPSTSLLNDTKDINGWEHPLCPVCSNVVYLTDRVLHEGYGYHKSCMRCQRCSQVTPAASAVRIKGTIYCKKHGTELLRRRSILMRKKSTMGRRSRHNRSRGGVPSDRFTVDTAPEAAPPVPEIPKPIKTNVPAAATGTSQSSQPRRVTTALRNFLEAAAEQIESQSFAPITPEPQPRAEVLPLRAPASEGTPAKRPLPVPKAKQQSQSNGPYLPKLSQQVPPPPQSVISHISSPPPSPGPATQRSSRSIFSGSRESLYDPNVVNALRQEAQRQISGSQSSGPSSPTRTQPDRNAQRLLSPCGPSIADALQNYAGKNGRVSVSSEFDPFESQDPLTNSFASPQQQRMPQGFSPNAQLDNLERRFRNANFRPPWALKSQSSLLH